MPAIHVFGSDAEPGDGAVFHSQTLAAASGPELNSLLPATGVVILRGGSIPESQALSAALSELESSDAAVVLVDSGSDFGYLCAELPVFLASLAMAPESRCAVAVDAERVRAAGGFQDVDSPIRELVVRLILKDEASVTAMTYSCGPPGALPPIDVELPLVDPAWPPRSHRWLASTLASLRIRDALPGVSSSVEATALHAGLWQTNDWLDESHQCSQSIEGDGEGNGDYWHAVMHRREPDASNSKYWFRRVGHHACFHWLSEVAATALDESGSPEAASWKNRLGASGNWDSLAFVDLCQATSRGGDAGLAQAARRIQWAEMLLLLVHTARAATS
ncbi:MAG: hypothetical protein H8E37_09530 [Planctomycetes bacterium]|nr:hypothetical protein [Planctomycetota bacterium]